MSFSKQGDGKTIVVVGSCFVDYLAYVSRMPKCGETLHSNSFAKGFGGKGANQAVMAGFLGSKTMMVSAVGEDADGNAYLAHLKKSGVDTTGMIKIKGQATGLTLINVDTNTGENQIVICPNSEGHFKPDSVNFNRMFKDPSVGVVICQNEIPLETSLAALKSAYEAGKKRSKPIFVIYNCAPAPTSIEERDLIIPYLKYVSLFCPNEVEATMFTGVNVTDTKSAFEACIKMHSMGIENIIITLGAKGYVISDKKGMKHFSAAKRVKAVDTTGAGDCYVGTLAHYIVNGWSLGKAAAAANVLAGMSVMKKGTQTSYPTRGEIPKELKTESDLRSHI